jgi:hypothetical protein
MPVGAGMPSAVDERAINPIEEVGSENDMTKPF